MAACLPRDRDPGASLEEPDGHSKLVVSVSLCRAAALALVLWFLCPGTAEAARFELQKIADTATTIPETAVLFGAFRGRPALDAGQVAFQGSGSGEEGVYLWEASVLSTAVSSSTPIPGGTGTFNQLR